MKLTEFCKTINSTGRHGELTRLSHHIQGSILVYAAKPLGFGTRSAMVKLHKGGWIIADPISWELRVTTLKR